MAEVAVAAVLQRVGCLVVQEATSLHEVPAKVETLKAELQRMQCFLADTDKRMERGEELVTNLVSEVRDVAYRVENIIDSANIMARENSRARSFMGAISKGAHYPFHCMNLYRIGKKIDQVTARIRVIFQEFTKYRIVSAGLNEIPRYSLEENEHLRAKRLLLPDFDDKVDVIGFDSEINQIKDELLDSENKDLTVLSLVGPGGAGKSTVARKVYNLVAKKHFNSSVWICISQQFTVYGSLKDIVEGTMGNDDVEELGTMKDMEVKKKIHNFLKEKRYLIVLDDVWSIEAWDMIEAAFPDVKNGSRVIMTTRNSAVSNHPNTRKKIHKLKLLNNEESIELFNRKAFPPYVVHDRNNLDNFRELGKTLALKCNGLPLAIVVLGGFLSKNYRILEWKRMVTIINWDAMKNEGDIKAILDLSYYDLSSNLKACFLYITSFPEDYVIPVGLLTKLWIAEGFIPNVRECSLKETALRYVEELAQRCMILIEDMSSGWIKTIKIHDVLRAWGLGRARREGFFKDCSCRNDVETAYSNEMRAHRVVLHGSVGVKVGVAIPNLHTLLLFNAARLEKSDFSLRGLNYLRVFYINGLRGEWKLPKEIGKMIHLRYLGLKGGGTYILPVSMGGLTNLHTFDAREARVDKLPSALWSILTLRYVHVYKVESEWSLPKISVQSNLKYLFIFLGCNMQEQSEATMQSYDRMERHPSWCFGKYYREVNQLEMVGSCEDEFGAPNSLHLRDLIFLPQNLKRLKFSCPNLLNDEDPMPTLGSWLQFLNFLEIGVRSYTGATMTCPSGGFPNLFNLALHDLDVETWILEDGAMPKLRILSLCKCTKLKALPKGLRYLQELRTLKVIAMPELCQDVCNILHEAGCKVVIRQSEEDFQHIQIPTDDGNKLTSMDHGEWE